MIMAQLGFAESENSLNNLNEQKTEKLAIVNNISPRTIWGKVIIKLRELHYVALHIACGDITDVSFVDNKFIINVTEDFIYELLKSEDNNIQLKSVLASLGVVDFEINKKDKIVNGAKEDIKKLKDMFGDKFIIKESKIY